VGSIISPDNTKIFYITQTDKSIDILQVKIIDNVPDFNNYQVLSRINNNGGIFKIPDLFYGHDGNIYVAYYMDKVGMIEFDDDGNAYYEDNILPSLPHFYPRTLNFVSTWFSDDYRPTVCTPKNFSRKYLFWL
jgi:hypothetical protein